MSSNDFASIIIKTLYEVQLKTHDIAKELLNITENDPHALALYKDKNIYRRLNQYEASTLALSLASIYTHRFPEHSNGEDLRDRVARVGPRFPFSWIVLEILGKN